MKITGLKLTSLFLLTIALAGCKKNSSISDRQAILFQVDYLNYSVSYQHNGFYIDNEGNVLVYNNPDRWNFPDRELRISASQVAENLTMCTHSGMKISKEELIRYAGHIKNISATKITAIKNAADDTGSTEYICYQLSENNEMYKGSIIRMEGDFKCENLNFFSKKVADWLKNINTNLSLK